MEDNYQKLLTYALRLVARKRYTEKEISTKLNVRKNGKKKDKESVIKRLKELNYLNDYEYARDYIDTRIKVNPKGIRMLKLELRLKGVNTEIIEEIIEKSKIDELKVAESLIKRKQGILKKLPSEKKRKKVITLLSSRGFGMSTIYKILDNC